MHGQVVQAVRGQRQHYLPIQSKLTASHALLDVVDAILQAYAFDCVYIADLNALLQNLALPDHQDHIQAAMQAFPQIEWWVDAGIRSPAQLATWVNLGVRPILASETLMDFASYQQLRDTAQRLQADALLSLDFFSDGFHGPQALLAQPTAWTNPTLLMSLPHVGSQQGPDLHGLRQMKQQQPQQRFYAAGGVRYQADIDALAEAGADGVLVASALHQQTLQLT